MPDWSSLTALLNDAGIAVSQDMRPTPISGGDISAAWRLAADDGDVFLKTGPQASMAMFNAEAEGLREIAGANALRVPGVLAVGQDDATAFLALEWISIERADVNVEWRCGEQLAALHRVTADQFGWDRDNTIGLTPQHNPRSSNWCAFFQEHRIGYQLKLAASNGYTGALQQQGETLLRRLPALFEGFEPEPSLLHGDLWGGNWGSAGGEPVIFDPAVYYGDRETDLAMTKLFGGFGPAFYESYAAAWPLPAGSEVREKLYQLYHVLNHLNLFGSAYHGRALALVADLL